MIGRVPRDSKKVLIRFLGIPSLLESRPPEHIRKIIKDHGDMTARALAALWGRFGKDKTCKVGW